MRTGTLTAAMVRGDSPESVLGVDLEQYARISAAMLRAGVTEPDAIDAFAVDHGVEAGAWSTVQATWVARMGDDDQLRDRYLAWIDQPDQPDQLDTDDPA